MAEQLQQTFHGADEGVPQFNTQQHYSTMQQNPFDLFETFFGTSMGGFAGGHTTGFRGRRASTVVKGEDIRYDMTLEFSEAIFWKEKEFGVSHSETCDACTGTGSKVGTKMRICSSCGGRDNEDNVTDLISLGGVQKLMDKGIYYYGEICKDKRKKRRKYSSPGSKTEFDSSVGQ
ncbi:chaperone protein DnaJ [Tanacetum coccineum]